MYNSELINLDVIYKLKEMYYRWFYLPHKGTHVMWYCVNKGHGDAVINVVRMFTAFCHWADKCPKSIDCSCSNLWTQNHMLSYSQTAHR